MGDPSRGLYPKFRVQRRDGSDAVGGKHEGCNYFVLDVTHDPHASVALVAYAESCRTEYSLLADDLIDLAGQTPNPAFPTDLVGKLKAAEADLLSAREELKEVSQLHMDASTNGQILYELCGTLKADLQLAREELATHCACQHDGRGELTGECQEHQRLREELATLKADGITGAVQNRIQEFVIERVGAKAGQIDGSGCDSGDPVDLTLDEIGQGFRILEDRFDEKYDALKAAVDPRCALGDDAKAPVALAQAHRSDSEQRDEIEDARETLARLQPYVQHPAYCRIWTRRCSVPIIENGVVRGMRSPTKDEIEAVTCTCGLLPLHPDAPQPDPPPHD